jgi:DEAD/DEAH box helicase domain-containing protein
LDPRLVAVLAERGTRELYAHQARAIELALSGRDVLVATPTASGKTLCYVAPVLQRLLETKGRSRSLFLFPTKALSQDQSANLNALLARLDQGWHSFTYDGDTPPSVRRTLREAGHIVLTNPWMLHTGILPNHGKWSQLFADLETIVIDEVHTLSGVFGSSVALVLRRLLRIARHYGSQPRFLLSSATLCDGAEHGARLIGRPVELVDEDGSPAGPKIFCAYNPPVVDAVAGLRKSALEEARALAPLLVGPGHQTIFFCNRRVAVEVLTRYLKESAHELGLEPSEIRGYRGGYLPDLRREIESGLRSGAVKVVVATNALELGIDVGALDDSVWVGYPGTQASFAQRAGRAGRRGKPSLCMLIARSDPLDQFLTQHPDWLFGRAREKLAIDPDNLVILSEQVKCAAFELHFTEEEVASARFSASPHLPGILDYLAEESKLLVKRAGAWHWMADAYPAQDVSLAGGEPDNVLVLDVETKKAIGEVDRAGSLTSVHPGAIYQVEGEIWKIESFDYKNRRAHARSVESDYFTEAETDSDLRVLSLERSAQRRRADGSEDYAVWAGEGHVTTLATQYKKIRFYTRENVGAEDIHLPPEELDTHLFALTLSDESARELALEGSVLSRAWRGVGSLVRRVVPLYLRCQPSDLGLSCEGRSDHFRKPTLWFFDKVQGGVGLAHALFDAHRELLGAAESVLARCDCRDGCPACIGPPEEGGAGAKALARALLAHLCAGAAPQPVEAGAIAVEIARGQAS